MAKKPLNCNRFFYGFLEISRHSPISSQLGTSGDREHNQSRE